MMSERYLSSFKQLAEYTGICVPTLEKLVHRSVYPLPSVKVSPRKYVFLPEQVNAWFEAEAARQAGGEL